MNKKSISVIIVTFLVIGAMTAYISTNKIKPHTTQEMQNYTIYEDNLNETEKAEIGLLGIASLKNITIVVTKGIDLAKDFFNGVKSIIDKLKPKENLIPIRFPGWNSYV